jgi:hypothetical protein
MVSCNPEIQTSVEESWEFISSGIKKAAEEVTGK